MRRIKRELLNNKQSIATKIPMQPQPLILLTFILTLRHRVADQSFFEIDRFTVIYSKRWMTDSCWAFFSSNIPS